MVASHCFDGISHADTQFMPAIVIMEDGIILHLDFQVKGVQPLTLIDDNAEVGPRFWELYQCSFNLAGKDYQTTNRDSIITTSLNCCYFGMRTPARAAILPPGTRNITTAITNHRRAISGTPSPDHLPIISFLPLLTS